MENWKNLIHLFVTVFLSNFAMLMVNPTIADVTLEAVCPGQDECSLAIYLTGFQQAIAGLGSMVIVPLIGNLSDVYGRKRLLAIPLTLSTIPLVILTVKRTTEFFYVYYVLKTLTSMVYDGGILCLSLSYLADNVSEGKRVSAFGIFAGVISAAMVCGTLAARLLPTAQIFQVAAVVSVVAAVYMKIFLKDTTCHNNEALEEPILKPENKTNEVGNEPLKNIDPIQKTSLPKQIIRLLRSSVTFSLASFVAFFNSLAEAGIQAFLTYYLKARFQFNKDQFADISLITYLTSTVSNVIFEWLIVNLSLYCFLVIFCMVFVRSIWFVSLINGGCLMQMLLMPTLGPLLGEEVLLCIGLFAGFLNMLLDSIAWAPWVPYASSFLGVFLCLASPSLRCIISKQVGTYEQGIAQGCILSISALSNVISPLIFSPLSALFLSDSAPFNFPGFSILCIGLAWFVGFILSLMIKILPLLSRNRIQNQHCTLA